MDDQSTDRPEPQVDSSHSKRGVGFGWLVWPAVFLLLYVLSVGPVLNLGGLPFSTVRTIYSPIFSAGRAFQSAQQCLDWYLAKWHVAIIGERVWIVETRPYVRSH